MRKFVIAVAFCLLLFCNIADAKIIGNFSTDAAGLKTVTLDQARVKEDNSSSANTTSNTMITQSLNSSSQKPEQKSENISGDDYLQNEVSAGNQLFVRSLIDDVYSNFNNSVYTALTFVPNPYQDKGVKNLYGGYLNLSIYMTAIFIFGALVNRSLARTKLAFRKMDLSHSAFIGGIAICCFAIVANVIFSGALDLVEALNKFITLPAMPEIVPNPDNLLLFAIKGLCDLLLIGFFVVRYYVIYIVAVVCSIIAVLLVPEFSRDFAKTCIEKIVRILALQPAALFVYVVCLIASEGLPDILKPFSYIGMTVLVAATCWYFLFGNFTLLKKGVSLAVSKGLVKI